VRSLKVARTWLLVVLLLIAPAMARAATRLCLQVDAAAEELEGLRKLVLDELGHHPSHELVEDGCETHLTVELFEVGDVRYLTARVNREVPVRHAIKDPDDLSHRLTSALSEVLRNDPVYLARDITRYSAMKRAMNSVLKRGHNIWRFELLQAVGVAGGHAVFASGGAFAVTRGADHWQIQARLYIAGSADSADGGDTVLRLLSGADAGLTYELWSKDNASPYLHSGLGVQLMRFDGRHQDHAATLTKVGAAFQVRAGLRFLRATDYDMDVFVTGYLPLYMTQRDGNPLFGEAGAYTPTMQMGIGVGF
jgi:hypothetical protein